MESSIEASRDKEKETIVKLQKHQLKDIFTLGKNEQLCAVQKYT